MGVLKHAWSLAPCSFDEVDRFDEAVLQKHCIWREVLCSVGLSPLGTLLQSRDTTWEANSQ